MSNNVEILIPYYRAYKGLIHLMRSVSLYTCRKVDVTILGFEECDFDINKLKDLTKGEVNYIRSNNHNVEIRLYEYLADTSYNSSIVIHTDVEILDFDPISEILAIGEGYKHVGMIGKNRMGRHISAGGFLPPTMSSHFLYVDNSSMSNIFRRVLNEDHVNLEGYVDRDSDIFPTRAYQIAISEKVQCLTMPLSIYSKIMHYNSSTRRTSSDITILNNYDSIRSTQVDIDSGLMTLRSKLNKQIKSSRPVVIIGISEDAISTMKFVLSKGISKEVYFYDQHTPLHGTKISGVSIISFSEACSMKEKPFFYICVPNYSWYVNFLQFSGLVYGVDYNVRLRHGHNLFDFEHMTYNPSIINDLYVDDDKVIEPNNMFIDSPSSKNLSFYNVSNYVIVVFFHIIRSTVRKIFRGNV